MGEANTYSSDPTEEMIRAGLNLIQQALSIYDRDLKLVVANSRFAEMFSLPRHLTVPGADFSETIRFLATRGEYGPVDDIDAFVTERTEQARAFEPHYMERTRANGRTISVEGSPLRQGGWVTVYTDITAIKRQETMLRARSEHLSDQLLGHSEDLAKANRQLAAFNAALEQAKRELTESEARTRLTSEMMPAHIAHLDPDRRYTYSNRKLASVIPGRPQDIVGLHAAEALGDEAYRAIRPYLDRGYGGDSSVFEFTHSEGGRRVRAAFTPDTQPDGQVTGVYVLSMDVTDEAQARAALAQTHKRELAAQMTSGLAHDFANLLTIILGIQSQLDRLDGLPEAGRAMVETTRAAARRGGVLLDRLSNISGKRDLHAVATDIPALLADIRAMARPSLPQDVELAIECEGIDAPALLDAGFLQDGLLNLVLNARDAIGTGPGLIRIAARRTGESWLDFLVSDSGPGFSETALLHAMDPFFTSKRNDEGSGLGLTLVYDFAQMSGGNTKIANRPEGGAQVLLRLPYRAAPAPARSQLVLLAEDTPEIRENVRAMLRGLGHSVIETTTADEAEALAGLPDIGAVLTDITLDGERTGLDLARALSLARPSLRVFVMTSLPPDNPTRQQAEAAFPLLAKPFDETELAAFLDLAP